MTTTNVSPLHATTARGAEKAAETVILEPLSGHQWRVVAANARHDDRASVLGFVEYVAGIYEVTFLSKSATHCYCATLDAVHAGFGTV